MAKRCEHCKKKTHIEYTCGCGHVFCVSCRHPEQHKCGLQYEKIQLIKVVAEKVDKI